MRQWSPNGFTYFSSSRFHSYSWSGATHHIDAYRLTKLPPGTISKQPEICTLPWANYASLCNEWIYRQFLLPRGLLQPINGMQIA